MKNSTLFTLIAMALGLIIAYNCLYVVKEIDRAVLLTFGEVTNFDVPPGIHGKMPGVHTVLKFDGRMQTLDAPAQSFLTAEKEYLEVDSYAKWRVHNTADYYRATSGDESRANNLLAQRINTGLRNQFGTRTVHEVVSGERDSLMTELTEELNTIAQNEFGIEVIDIRVKKIDLPPNVSESVYQRMNTERQEEARELRSTGEELAEGIRAEADRESVVIEANAYRDAEYIRGEGDATASATYAEAFNQDAEFYGFTRSLNAYIDTFSDYGDVLVISPDSDFFKYLNKSTQSD
ncbi:MAG: protease modulator HflC [Gammaproteobacteria bacterium]|jgi:membrane protease subunit HflC|nr:protease modulator HflC [Gammaproteobacteria bacterium]MBT6042847.1 protease modulator HflC [Gammaproteobacteria bacterium]